MLLKELNSLAICSTASGTDLTNDNVLEEGKLKNLAAALILAVSSIGATAQSEQAPKTQIVQKSDAQPLDSSYLIKVHKRIAPNFIFVDVPPKNPAIIAMQVDNDGKIVDPKVTSSSGNTEWDEAALRALKRTVVLPRNEDGKFPSAVSLSFGKEESTSHVPNYRALGITIIIYGFGIWRF